MTSAVVRVTNAKNQPMRCRVLLDTCSTANFITERLANDLGLPKKRCCIPVGALDQLATATKHVVTVTFSSLHNRYAKTLEFLTVSRVADLVPSETLPRDKFPIPANIRLADPEFHKPAPIDMLIGSGPTLSLFCIGQIKLSPEDADCYLQKTRLGWVIGGNFHPSTDTKPARCNVTEVHCDLTRFWEIEEGSRPPYFSAEELECERHFQQHTTRDDTGRYIVALPFKKNADGLGDSRARAQKRLESLMSKLQKNSNLKQQYSSVIQEYLDLGHMEVVEDVAETKFYLPHHAVVKETSLTTKLRVVFDGSAKTSTGVSLNDALMVGPTIQDDIFSHMLRFRLHNYVLIADIEKMYRQILIRNEDRKYLRILWKEADEIVTYELNTVTFGLAPAPFLAIRCLHQLAEDEGDHYPTAAKILKKDLYVDDLLTGADTIEEAHKIRSEITQLLRSGQFKLRQWASNDLRTLHGLDDSDINPNFQLDKDQTTKTLGISWDAKNDAIKYTAKPIEIGLTATKRIILSEIAKIYDPLGLLGPIILYAKILMQQLWQLKLDWDESVPSSIYTSWIDYCTQLKLINNLSFDRKILISEVEAVQLHGFCDASERGYGACIYIRSTDREGRVRCKLFCAKSRVAPLKTVTLPRLELCAAQLLAKLYKQTIDKIELSIEKPVFWTDSTITLHWINTSPHVLKTFVANRVADIQDKTHASQWKHVRSNDNPADALSRGQLPADFLQNSDWQNGPTWLEDEESLWPRTDITGIEEIPEMRKNICLAATTEDFIQDLLKKISSFTKLKRIIAYCRRFKTKKSHPQYLQPDELIEAEKLIIKLVQTSSFADEIRYLSKGERVNKKSKILSLNPFMDQDGVIRVGGRLKNSALPYAQQHPMLLPRSHRLTDLIIKEYHRGNLHSGIQTTLYALRRKFWPLDGRNQVRKIVRNCIPCFRTNPPTTEYLMGDLPGVRTTEARPFSNVGVDYCGPFFVKEKKFRNRTRIKVYVAVFVCLAVKAVHLEVVSDMTSEGFLAALRRFISRRGRPQRVYSDNGTNFVGANNELKEMYAILNSDHHQELVTKFSSDNQMTWHFIPPLSPHFGGLWESTVKSFKHHLKRVVSDLLFTFEEFNTFAIEVEAILNSRPLTPIPTDPNDILVLTPGHFLIGDSLTSLPEADFSSTPSNRLSHWQHVQKVRRDFWARWHKEYLNELNIRRKWNTGQHAIKVGTVVILKEDNLPPMQWALGRVTETHPGADGIVRTVTVKTSKSEFKRNVKRIAPLPINENRDDKEST